MFAKFPFRGPMGKPFGDGGNMKGTYPWIDKEAKVLTALVNGSKLYKGLLASKDRYSTECVHAGCEKTDFDSTNDMTVAVFGGWTKGKMVVMDNMLNQADYRIGLSSAVKLSLYESDSAHDYTDNKSRKVAVGGTRVTTREDRNAIVPHFDQYGNELGGLLMKNSSIFDSVENRFNYNKFMKPVTPQDIVWNVGTGFATEEFAFDDYLNDNAFIISNMVGAFQVNSGNKFRMIYNDAWNSVTGYWTGSYRIQNGATTLRDKWNVPSSGKLRHGRIEPVANGGVKGKGVWFNGDNTELRYDISSRQPQKMDDNYWFHSLFIQPRDLRDNKERVVMNFGDRSRLTIRYSTNKRRDVKFSFYDNYGNQKHKFYLNRDLVEQRWLSLGLLVHPGAKKTTVYINGFPHHDFTTSDKLLEMNRGGDIALGKAIHRFELKWGKRADKVRYDGFEGWMDEYKLFSYKPDYETSCNFANGTLIGINDSHNDKWSQIANSYSSSMHNKISQALNERGERQYKRYACYTNNFSKGRLAHMANIPTAHTSLRASIHFPEGPIFHDAPRPDSTNNEFCLSCHSQDAPGGLSIKALEFKNIPAKYDPRRQPSQPPAKISGNLPAEFINSIDGNWSFYGSNLIDEYILPSKN